MYRIGIDIGGTNVKMGIVNEDLRIVARRSMPFPWFDAKGSEQGRGSREHAATECQNPASAQSRTSAVPTNVGEERRACNNAALVADAIAEAVRAMAQEEGIAPGQIEGVGVVVPGSIDAAGETVIDAHNLGLHDAPLRALFARRFSGTLVRMGNDADGAALAELACGALAGCQTAVFLTLGTGVGGSVILNGRLFQGGTGQGVELGHMAIEQDGEPCTCGNKGCAEACCSAGALAREGARAAAKHPESPLAHQPSADAAFVIECAKAGDAAACEAFDIYISHLGSLCASLLNIFDPEAIALGGGVAEAGAFLFEPLRKQASEKCFFRTHGPIVGATMGNDAGIVGAALLARQ